ncbi:MAG: RNA degradosome polyphosphate kinase, partial [Clostridiales bacterium]|nr:RNA degradosome polyphosphate kinase [Clostridiales bacterium]
MAAAKSPAKKVPVKKNTAKKNAVKKSVAKKPAGVAEKKPRGVKVALKKTGTPKPKVAAKKPSAAAEKTKDYKSDKYASFLSSNAKFFNRELSWIEFDERILHEARDVKNPLLERLNFLSITASNLDEFYIVRVASLRDMQSIEFTEKDIAGFTVSEQLERIDERTRKLMSLMYSTYGRTLVPALAQEKIFLKDYNELGEEEQKIADSYFRDVLY